MTAQTFSANFDYAIDTFINKIANSNAILKFSKPIITKMFTPNLEMIKEKLILVLSDKDGNVDIKNLVSDMIDNLKNTEPFTITLPVVGEVRVDAGTVNIDIPIINQELSLNYLDFEEFKTNLFKIM